MKPWMSWMIAFVLGAGVGWGFRAAAGAQPGRQQQAIEARLASEVRRAEAAEREAVARPSFAAARWSAYLWVNTREAWSLTRTRQGSTFLDGKPNPYDQQAEAAVSRMERLTRTDADREAACDLRRRWNYQQAPPDLE